jgi:GTPase SAR1 family protein
VENIRHKWISEVRKGSPGAPIVLCGCKTDLREDHGVVSKLAQSGKTLMSEEEGRSLAVELGCVYSECSALTRRGLNQVFRTAVKQGLTPPAPATRQHRSPLERARAYIKNFRGA